MRTIALLLGFLCAVSCTEDGKTRATDEAPAKAVARLAELSGSVDHRAARTLTWEGADKGMKLYHRDALKTGKGATARVAYTGGAELRVDERSLVVIEAPEAPPAGEPARGDAPAPRVAKLEQGTIRGVARPGAEPVRVVTPDGKTTEIAADGDQEVPFRVRAREGGKLEVAVLKGRATVRSGGGKAVKVEPRQVVDVTGAQVSAPVKLPPYPELGAPPVDAKVATGSKMKLIWKPVEGASMYRVQVSHLVSFAERLYDTTVVVPEFSLPAPEARQTYVWRVAAVDDAGRESEFGYARRFHVTAAELATPGQLLSPPDNAGIQYVGRPKPVVFRWKGESERGFELVVARDPSLERRVVRRKRTRKLYARVKRLRAGEYHWGVYVRDGKQRKPLFDKPHKLVIARRRPPYVNVPKTIKWK